MTTPPTIYKIELPRNLAKRLEEIAINNDIAINDLIRLSLLKTARHSKFYDLTDPLRFGKYSDEFVETVIKADPSYMIWLCQNIEGFHLSDEAEGFLIDTAHNNKIDVPENLYGWEKI